MATPSSVLAWRIPGTGEPDGLLSMGSHRVGHGRSDLAAAAVCNMIPRFAKLCCAHYCLISKSLGLFKNEIQTLFSFQFLCITF